MARMQAHVSSLMPAFQALDYRFDVNLSLDENMYDPRGFRSSGNVLGDATAGGRIRLRPSALCRNDALARAVVAHEMSHVALRHVGMQGSGVVLSWEGPPPVEMEADRLAYKVLQKAGGDRRAIIYVRCWLDGCGETPPPRGLSKRGRQPSPSNQ